MKVVLSYMLIAIGCLVAMAACQSKPNTGAKGAIQDVTPIQFASLLQGGDGQLVDVRTPQEFASGHIEGAININYYDDDFSTQVKDQLDLSKSVYVYCRSGGRSDKAAHLLTGELKWPQPVYNLLGGYMAWPQVDK